MCGNFGLILLFSMPRARLIDLMRRMLKVTTVRGAQSAGLVTYDHDASISVGRRYRVVSTKRGDLGEQLLATLPRQTRGDAKRIFQGHTRFATSSICNLSGCHPHQWLPRRLQTVWTLDVRTRTFVAARRSVEGFVTHNGDLDFFTLHGTTYSLGDVQRLLGWLLGRPMPSDVDSACVAGLLDLLRTKGVWSAAVRYGYVYGALSTAAGSLAAHVDSLASPGEIGAVAALFEDEWDALLAECDAAALSIKVHATEIDLLAHYRTLIEGRMHTRLAAASGRPPLPGVSDKTAAMRRLASSAVSAFFDGDLLRAARELMSGAMGSFGLVLSHSLDAAGELVLAARGQTMSAAIYPALGLVAFGSEAAATRVGMDSSAQQAAAAQAAAGSSSFRIDLDDVTGEVLLLRWGDALDPAAAAGSAGSCVDVLCGGGMREATVLLAQPALLAVSTLEHGVRAPPLWRRRLKLDGNPLITPLPATLGGRDPVGADLLATPAVLARITADFDTTGNAHSSNRIAAWTFTAKLRERLRAHRNNSSDGSVDLLITGCEVSLWVGEQFAADVQLAYPTLRVLVLSANKLLGQLGQAMPIPSTGFGFNAGSHSLRDSLVLVLSHSGGTFAPLACCSLLSAYTKSIFVVTSEIDTQAARAVRAVTGDLPPASRRSSVRSGRGGLSDLGSTEEEEMVELNSLFVFCTHAGFRPAEPCSLSVVATHHLLTQLLLFLMGYLSHFEHGEANVSICGSSYSFMDVRELAMINRKQAAAAAQIIGESALGDTPSSALLRRHGRRWAQHVLEGPRSWILSLAYIAITVVLGATPLSAVTTAVVGRPLPSPFGAAVAEPALPEPAWLWALRHVVALLDVTIYAFLNWWPTILIRLVQGRPWLHRVAGRSVLIGDVPWVAQCTEAFASKLFGLAYSIATCTFSSANPADHLVHRHTHRVVRGSLLAVGRPDGRANAMTTAEAACTLSVNQASSIQNYGVTCESLTLGHSSFQLPLSFAHVTLPTARLPWASEVLGRLESEPSRPSTPHVSVHAASAHAASPSKNPSIHGFKATIRRIASGERIASDPSVHGGGTFLEALIGSSTHGAREQGYVSRAALLERLAAGVPAASEPCSPVVHRKRRDSGAGLPPTPELVRRNLSEALLVHVRVDETEGDEVTPTPPPSPPDVKPPPARPQLSFADDAPNAVKAAFARVGMRSRRLFDRAAGPFNSDSLHAFRKASFALDPIDEPFLGAWMARGGLVDLSNTALLQRQHTVQTLSETRFDSMQRLLGFFVLFHAMGEAVANWWPTATCGLFGYDMSRTQSMMRVATTASPVSGMEVRERIEEVREEMRRERAVRRIQRSWRSVRWGRWVRGAEERRRSRRSTS